MLSRMYMYELERDISTCSDESEVSDFDKNVSEECSEDNVRLGILDWSKTGNCLVAKREIDCLCCFEVHALNSKFDTENISCIIQSEEFKMLCTSEIVLKNVLTSLHEFRGDHLEDPNRSLRYAVYKQFIRWVFTHLGKGNRRVIRDGSRAAVTSKMECFVIIVPAVNCYHKALHLGCCSSPRSASGHFFVSIMED